MNTIVLDTHAFIWYLSDSPLLSRRAAKAVDEVLDNGGIVFISAITLVEVQYLVEKGRIGKELFSKATEAMDSDSSGLKVLPLDLFVANHLGKIPRESVPDMPDRIIARPHYRWAHRLLPEIPEFGTAGSQRSGE